MRTPKKASSPSSYQWLTNLISIIGALAWIPFLVDYCAPHKLQGKLISNYANFGKFNGQNSSMFLFKVGLISENHELVFRDIDIRVRFANSDWTSTTTQNNRLVVLCL